MYELVKHEDGGKGLEKDDGTLGPIFLRKRCNEGESVEYYGELLKPW